MALLSAVSSLGALSGACDLEACSLASSLVREACVHNTSQALGSQRGIPVEGSDLTWGDCCEAQTRAGPERMGSGLELPGGERKWWIRLGTARRGPALLEAAWPICRTDRRSGVGPSRPWGPGRGARAVPYFITVPALALDFSPGSDRLLLGMWLGTGPRPVPGHIPRWR